MVARQRLDAHLTGALGIVVEHTDGTGLLEHRDGITITAVGVGNEDFNTAWVTELPSDPGETIAWSVGQLAAAAPPWMLQVPGSLAPVVVPALDEAGLALSSTVPGMVRSVTTDVPPPPPGLRVERVTTAADLDIHWRTAAIGFGAPPDVSGPTVLPPTIVDDERVVLFNGYVDGADEPAATAISVIAAGIAGIYAVTVHETARRRGFGAAMTWAAVAAGARDGVDLAALQASAMGEPVYRRMGFTVVEPYHRYVPTHPSSSERTTSR